MKPGSLCFSLVLSFGNLSAFEKAKLGESSHASEKEGELSHCGTRQCHFYLLGKGGYVLDSVGLFVCLSVCGQHYSKSYERIGMKFYGGVLGSTMKN